MKRMRKVFSTLLAFAMVLLLFPASAMADDNGNTDTKTDGIVVDKTATLEDDGTYTIDISAYSTGTTTSTTVKSGVPLDIVLVLDQSGSMKNSNYVEPLKNAVTSFVNTISDNAREYKVDHRVALVGYASRYDSNSRWANTGLFINGSLYNYQQAGSSTQSTRLTEQNYKEALVSVNGADGNVTNSITAAISIINGNGATYTSYGMEMANGVFKNNPIEEGSNRQRIVVVFTDGEPGQSGYNAEEAGKAVNYAYTTKNTYGAKIYTIGLYSNASSNVQNFMNYLSSNYPNAECTISSSEWWYSDVTWNAGSKDADKYYATTSNSNELNNIFTNISDDVTQSTSSVTLDADSVLKDIMANGLQMTADSTITAKTYKGTVDDSTDTVVKENETGTGSGLTTAISTDKLTATVTGFDYSTKYIAKSHEGEILEVKITGVIPSDASVTNNIIQTNDAVSGIYAKNSTEPTVTFPQPTTILTSKSYVLDYAKEFTMNPADWKQTSYTLYNSFTKETTAPDYGVLDGLKYTPKTTNWDGYDSFYALGKSSAASVTDASANANGNLWSKINVIPANNVYYEDDFVTDNSNGTVGIVYTGEWTTDGTSAGNKETADGDVQGWETSLADDTTYSDGRAHVSSTAGATATFTFTGTGVDIYSRTDMKTGTVTANLYTGTEVKKAKIKKALIVDNKSVSGDQYYQIPTLSFEKLDYGTYTVKITVTSQAADRTMYYLDGIRVYNPVKEDATVQEAYGNSEIKAVFTKARDLLQSGSLAFIDEGSDNVGDYTNSEIGKIAPENEIYLSKNRSIVLQVNGNGANAYYLGLKAPQGATSIDITNGSYKSTQNIGHSTDLYYRVVPNGDGKIVVKNTGDNLLSITKLRTAGSGESGTSTISEDGALYAVRSFMSANYVPYSNETVTDEELVEQETPVVTEPETTESEESGEVIIENSVDSEDQPEVQQPVSNTWIKGLFGNIKRLFGR